MLYQSNTNGRQRFLATLLTTQFSSRTGPSPDPRRTGVGVATFRHRHFPRILYPILCPAKGIAAFQPPLSSPAPDPPSADLLCAPASILLLVRTDGALRGRDSRHPWRHRGSHYGGPSLRTGWSLPLVCSLHADDIGSCGAALLISSVVLAASGVGDGSDHHRWHDHRPGTGRGLGDIDGRRNAGRRSLVC